MVEQMSLEVYKWKYDDGSQYYAPRYCLSSGEKGWFGFRYAKSKKELNQKIFELKKKYNITEIVYKKCCVPGGLDSMHPSDFPEKDPDKIKTGILAMKKMLGSCGGDIKARAALLNLVSGILAGYCSRECSDYYQVDYIQKKYIRAPVISVRYSDYAYITLEKIVRSLAVDTAIWGWETYGFSKKPLRVKYRPVFPHKAKDRNITSSAYIKLPGLSHQVMPQYRDTTVLVHCRFFPTSEIVDLQRQNPWVSLVLFDAPAKKLLSSPVEVTGLFLAHSNCDWDINELQYTVERYVSYLTRNAYKKRWRKHIKKCFCEIEKLILQHNTSANITPIKYAQKYRVIFQLLALQLYLDACCSDGGISSEEAAQLLASWYQTLLPGCHIDKIDLEQTMTDIEEPEPYQVQFENVICRILSEDDFQHVCFVPEKNICPLKTDDNKTEYWAYLKYYRPKGPKKAQFLALLIRRSTFENRFSEYCPSYRGENPFKDAKQLATEYLGKFKARMYPNETDAEAGKAVDAIILNVDHMSFLPQELSERLRRMAPNTAEKDE